MMQPLNFPAMKNVLLTGALLLHGMAVLAVAESKSTTVHFASDQHTLSDEARLTILQFLDEINMHGDYEFQIHGHTDQQGDHAYNDALSKRRAAEVKAFFESQGIETTLLFTEAFGKKQLLMRRHDAEAMQRNRRVDITFKRFYFENAEELLSELATSTHNSFELESHVDNTLTCSRGSRIFIPQHAFVNSSGEAYTGRIQLEAVEALDFHDFIANGLRTESDGAALQTGGMMRVQAFAENGTPLMLADGTSLSVGLAANGLRMANMSLFTSGDGQNWQPTGQPALLTMLPTAYERPYRSRVDCELPRFEYMVPEPKVPAEPRFPILPRPPRRESYNREARWYELFSKTAIAMHNEQRYQKAMERYHDKMLHYHKAVDQYEARILKYPEYRAAYKAKQAQWLEDKELAEKNFMETEWQEALDACFRLNELKDDEYAAAYALWDSLRIAENKEYYEKMANLGFLMGSNPNQYIFEETGLGWINCDRFYDVPQAELEPVMVQVPYGGEGARVLLILPDAKSVLGMASGAGGNFSSNPVPRYERQHVVAYRITEGAIQVAHAPVEPNQPVKLTYSDMRLNEFRQLLKDFNV